MSRHDKRVVKFVPRNRDPLDRRRRPSSRWPGRPRRHGGGRRLRRAIEQQTGWRPTRSRLFSGALLYTHYGFLERHVMKKIAQDKPGHLETDTSRDYVYTEWDGVKHFAEDFLADLRRGQQDDGRSSGPPQGRDRDWVPAESRCRGRLLSARALAPAADGLRSDHEDRWRKARSQSGGIRELRVSCSFSMSSIRAADSSTGFAGSVT